MRIISVLVFITMAMPVGLAAQSNTSTNGLRLTQIRSDSGYFNIHNRQAVYDGHVRVDDPQLKMTCDKLTATTPAQGGRVDHIVGEGHVVLDMVDEGGKTNHATGEKLVYAYVVENSVTNETAVLTGHPRMESDEGWSTASKITWNRMTGRLEFVDWQSGTTNAPAKPSTNTTSLSAVTNVPASPDVSAITNVPPPMPSLRPLTNLPALPNPTTTP